jgi:hypothetical protein
VAEHSAKALVVYEAGASENEKTARWIAERLGEAGRDVAVKSSAEAMATDLQAARLYVLGAEGPNAPSYGALALALRGLNLAGRKAAFFGGSGAAVAWLRSICEDTEVTAAHADLVARRPEPTAVSAWLKLVIAGA